jgi:hypothetical protein
MRAISSTIPPQSGIHGRGPQVPPRVRLHVNHQSFYIAVDLCMVLSMQNSSAAPSATRLTSTSPPIPMKAGSPVPNARIRATEQHVTIGATIIFSTKSTWRRFANSLVESVCASAMSGNVGIGTGSTTPSSKLHITTADWQQREPDLQRHIGVQQRCGWQTMMTPSSPLR